MTAELEEFRASPRRRTRWLRFLRGSAEGKGVSLDRGLARRCSRARQFSRPQSLD